MNKRLILDSEIPPLCLDDDDIETLCAENNELKKQVDELQRKVDTIEETNKELDKSLDHAKKEKEALDKQIDDFVCAKTRLERQIRELEWDAPEALRIRNHELRETIANLRTEIECLKNSQAQGRNENYQHEADALTPGSQQEQTDTHWWNGVSSCPLPLTDYEVDWPYGPPTPGTYNPTDPVSVAAKQAEIKARYGEQLAQKDNTAMEVTSDSEGSYSPPPAITPPSAATSTGLLLPRPTSLALMGAITAPAPANNGHPTAQELHNQQVDDEPAVDTASPDSESLTCILEHPHANGITITRDPSSSPLSDLDDAQFEDWEEDEDASSASMDLEHSSSEADVDA
jgi:prefoldin subunit 5